MAASTASSSPLTAFLHRHDERSRRRARFVVAASTADAEPSPEATAAASTAGPGMKKTVDTRIHWSDPDEGWVGGKAKKEGDGRKDEPMGRRFADLINNPSRLEDPYELDLQNYEPVPDTVDRLGGKNMELSDQAMTALAFDIGIIIFSICCIIYALFFKEQY
ncbi:unnamed protein product [Triticum turgidum subsp. durum]|uniref:Uncharacterized protein n=1 Tax=Triticum turgidum subsp. durum TaxID=4567 RepID=A0A9R0VZJ1_TRITD|nr:unnamed protein product [Triticum turgidum subsp. durum]